MAFSNNLSKAYGLVRHSSNDPDDTLFVAMTTRELALITLGMVLIHREYEEYQPLVEMLQDKLVALIETQKNVE